MDNFPDVFHFKTSHRLNDWMKSKVKGISLVLHNLLSKSWKPCKITKYASQVSWDTKTNGLNRRNSSPKLTLLVPISDEERKLTWIFYFHSSLRCIKSFVKAFKVYKTTNKFENKNLSFFFNFNTTFWNTRDGEGLTTAKKILHL